ncbi:MAG TPA: ComF family protein [Longimicrobiaceae bacterium]|jgi:ComF family protein|nr:ComF family protein [Longimicrobiaceae bacterium]
MAASTWMRRLAEGALDLVLAPVCVACHAPIPPSASERLICAVCWSRLEPLAPPCCARCGAPLPAPYTAEARCRECTELPPSVRAVRSVCSFAGPAKEIVHALKYGGWTAVAEPMARRIAALSLPRDVEDEARIVLPVPLSAARLRERGYNQAELLAGAIARRTGRRCAPEALLRTRRTHTQTSLHPSERRANVAGAFAVPAPHRATLAGEHVLLIDDVWTTGATAVACTEALVAAGARVVSVLTFARTLPDRARHAR